MFNKECTLRKVAQENESIIALELRWLRKKHSKLEKDIEKYQERIAHLQEAVSDYSAYLGVVPLPLSEREKSKRKSR